MSSKVIDRKKRRANMTISFNKNPCEAKNSTKQIEEIVKGIEDREKQKFSSSKRQLALALHRQADELHRKLLPGDYEAALVLYHRAAGIHPQNTSHVVAAKKISSFILSTSTKHSVEALKIQKNGKTSQSLSQLQEQRIEALKRTLDSGKNVGNFRSHVKKDLQEVKSLGEMELIRSRMLDELSDSACKTLTSLKKAFNDNDFKKSLQIGNELLEIIASGLEDDCNYRIAAHRYLALSHLSLGRHDEALDHSIKMIHFAKEANDVKLQVRSFAVFGKVHLTFGHLNAAAIGWTDLLGSLEEAIPKAWLLHEIGRCHYEMGNYLKALEISRRCCNWAEEGDSNKWIYHGKLLGGQALVSLGRFAEGIEALRCACNVAKIERDVNMAGYIENLMDRVGEALRSRGMVEKKCMTDIAGDLEGREGFGEISQLTSRTQIIQGDKNKVEINEETLTKEIDVDTCFVEKWKKYLDRSKRMVGGINEGRGGREGGEGIDEGRDGGGGIDEGSGGMDGGDGSSSDGGGKGDESENSGKTFGVERDRLYQCFIGNEAETDNDN